MSAGSAWEIAIKLALGKLAAPPEPHVWLPREVAANSFTPLPIAMEHALAVAALPLHHADPFDRLLVAQAKLEQLAIVTGDQQLTRYDVEIVLC